MSAVTLTPQQYVLAVQRALTPLADQAKAEAMKAYLLNQFEFLGLPAPVRRTAVKDIGKVQWQSADAVLAAAELLWQKPQREYRYTAVNLLREHSAMLGVNDLPALQALLLRDPWWETVDGLSAVIAEVVHAAMQQQPNAATVMDVWLKHPSHWVRRSAMLHQLGWRLDTDPTRWNPQEVTEFKTPTPAFLQSGLIYLQSQCQVKRVSQHNRC